MGRVDSPPANAAKANVKDVAEHVQHACTSGYTGIARVTVVGDVDVSAYAQAIGLYAHAYGSANVDVTGDVTVSGAYGAGIDVSAGTTATIYVDGDITTTGDDVEGVTSVSYGDVSVTVTGAISTNANTRALRSLPGFNLYFLPALS